MKSVIKTLTLVAIGVAIGRVKLKTKDGYHFTCDTLVLDGDVKLS